MRCSVRPRALRRAAIALALAPVFGSVCAQDSAMETSVGAGIGALTGERAERALAGQYNGLRDDDFVGLLGFDYSRLAAGGGLGVSLRATDLLLDTREVNLLWRWPGHWKFGAEYGELVWRDPNTIHSGLRGAGTTRPQVAPLAGAGRGSDLDLRIERRDVGLALSKVLGATWEVDLSLKSGTREGARLFGIGFNCPSSAAPGCGPTTGSEVGWATLLVPEPIDARHTQIEARLSFGGARLRASVGYYGSFYRNAHATLNPDVPASLNNAVGTRLPLSSGLQAILNQPLALPPDNDAHQLDLSGVFAFTPSARVNFKLGYAQALQDQDFAAAGLGGAPAGVSSLDGKWVTTLAQLGFTARPLPRLSVAASAQYRERDDRTPLAAYNVVGTTAFTNRELSHTRVGGKLQANYQFTADVRGALAATYEAIDRGVFTPTAAIAGTSALRQETEELGARAELRRRMADDFSAAVSLERTWRDGSNWLKDASGLGVIEVPDPSAPSADLGRTVFIPALADRRRDKAKLAADWQPTEALALQLVLESGRDRYSTPSQYGLRSTRMSLASLDAGYALSETWRLNAHVSYGEQTLHQARPDEAILSFDNTTAVAGAGFAGRLFGVELGGDASYIEDRSVYAQTLEATAGGASVALLAATGGLPDIVLRQTRLTLFGAYELAKHASLRLTVVHQRAHFDDWAWSYNDVPFSYADGSTVRRLPVQEVTFVGLTYVYRWQ